MSVKTTTADRRNDRIAVHVQVTRGIHDWAERVDLDGDITTIARRDYVNDTQIAVTVGGRTITGTRVYDLDNGYVRRCAGYAQAVRQGMTGLFGATVWCSPATRALIEDTVAAAVVDNPVTDEMAAWQQAERARIAAGEEYDQHAAAVDRMMTLGGNTY